MGINRGCRLLLATFFYIEINLAFPFIWCYTNKKRQRFNMIKLLDLQDDCIAKEVLDLEEISYRIEAVLIGFHDIPPLNDSIASLKECDETFYGYFVDDRLAGIISYKLKDRCL